MDLNFHLNAAKEMWVAVYALHRTVFYSESTLKVSEEWELCRITFDVICDGERVAKLLIPATEHLRYRDCNQIDIAQFTYVG